MQPNMDIYPLMHPCQFVPSTDLNEDGTVNIIDVSIVAKAFHTTPGDDD